MFHPFYKKEYPAKTVLRDLASQEACDGVPYDQMIEAADVIADLEVYNQELVKNLEFVLEVIPEETKNLIFKPDTPGDHSDSRTWPSLEEIVKGVIRRNRVS